MPEISRFLGIVIGMFYSEHGAPHSVDIESRAVQGEFPRRALRLVLEWASLHESELRVNWDLVRPHGRVGSLRSRDLPHRSVGPRRLLARRGESLNRIAPLE